jgi:hypothetical protein
MAVVVPMMVAMVTVPRHSQHTPNATDDATTLTSVNNALGLRSKRQSKKNEDAGNHYNSDFRGRHSIIQHSQDELCNGTDDNRRRVSRCV